mgnify:CR=1 FL=1
MRPWGRVEIRDTQQTVYHKCIVYVSWMYQVGRIRWKLRIQLCVSSLYQMYHICISWNHCGIVLCVIRMWYVYDTKYDISEIRRKVFAWYMPIQYGYRRIQRDTVWYTVIHIWSFFWYSLDAYAKTPRRPGVLWLAVGGASSHMGPRGCAVQAGS